MQQTRDLVDSFFINVHVKCPMLDEPRIRETVSRLFLHGIDWSAESCLALLICALGAIAAPFGCDDPAPSGTTAYLTATSFYAAAQKRFGPLLGASQLLEAQCLFFAGVFKMSVLERFAAWRLFNQALACCQCFVFLRQSRLRAGDGLSGADSCEVRSAGSQDASTAEQAVYWSAWKSERELRRDLWLPDFHSSETELVDYPSFFPTPPADVDNPDRVLNREHQQRQAASWYFFLSEISLLRLSSLIANDILTFRPLASESLTQGLANTVLQHEAQVFEWANTLHEDASLQSSPAEDGICKFILRGHLIDLREKIYWVFVDAAINGCSDGANEPPLMNDSILDLAHTGLQNHVERLRVNRPGFRHRHHGTPLMLRTCARSALVLIAAELAVQEAKRRRLEPIIEMPAGWEQAITDVIELCRFWEIDAPELVHMRHKIEKLWDKIREFECPE
ncbi:hypothetical protein BKA61DRAFT_622277 [Leptodontidium sp. MPI-SDFR-AT-0119]|nr:hypothetical protein BKA61DRAFT_622277 [Leptodontidium sp. MPI-SDFR-AT-0119]